MTLAILVALLAPAHADTNDWYRAMRDAWSRVGSYRADQYVQERVGGTLLAEQQMRVVWRRPGEIQLEWVTVHAGRRVYWAAHRFGGYIRIDPGGMFSPVLSLSTDNFLLKRETNHHISEAGMAYLVQRVLDGYARDDAAGKLPEGRPDVVRGEAVWTIPLAGDAKAGYDRAELSVGQQTDLPTRYAAWNAKGELIEQFHWLRVAVNPPLVDQVDFELGY
jgi:hypothetical protein